MLDVSQSADAAIIRATGEIDGNSCTAFDEALRSDTVQHADIVIMDFENCVYVDASCLHILIAYQNRLNKRLRIVVKAGSSPARMFELGGIAHNFHLYESVAAAIGVKANAEASE